VLSHTRAVPRQAKQTEALFENVRIAGSRKPCLYHWAHETDLKCRWLRALCLPDCTAVKLCAMCMSNGLAENPVGAKKPSHNSKRSMVPLQTLLGSVGRKRVVRLEARASLDMFSGAEPIPSARDDAARAAVVVTREKQNSLAVPLWASA